MVSAKYFLGWNANACIIMVCYFDRDKEIDILKNWHVPYPNFCVTMRYVIEQSFVQMKLTICY
jgi:hypothetical protein